MVKKILKIFLSVTGSILLLVIVLVFLVAAGVFNNAIAGFIERQAAGSLNGKLLIGSIEGRPVSDLSIKDILLIHEADTIVSGDELMLDYSLAGLLRKEVVIDLAAIKGFRINAEQDRDSVWNFTRIMKPAEAVKDTTESIFDWKIVLREFKVEDLVANIVTTDTAGMIPERAAIDLALNASVDGDTMKAVLSSFRLVTSNPDFEVRELRGDFSKAGELLSWSDLSLELTSSFLASHGTYNTGREGAAEAVLEMQPLDLADLRMILPDLAVNGSPDISAAIDGNAGKYNFTLNITEDSQNAGLSGYIKDISGDPEYSADIIAGNIDISHWLPEMKLETDISADIGITGKGFDIKENQVDLAGSFTGLSYQNYTTERVDLRISKKGESATGTMDAITFMGNASVRFLAGNMFGRPSYDVFLDYSGVDIGTLIDSVETDLNGTLHVKGSGTNADDLDAELVFTSKPSVVFAEETGEFGIEGHYDRGRYNFTTGSIETPWFMLRAEGSGNLKTGHRIDFVFEPREYDTLLAFMGLPGFDLEGIIEGNITGNSDSMFVNARASLSDIFYDSITVSSADAAVEAVLAKGKYIAGLELRADSISLGSMAVRSAEVNGSIADSLVNADLQIIYNDSLSADFRGSVEGFSSPLIRIKDLGIVYDKTEWRTGHDSAYITMGETAIDVSRFSLRSGDQELSVDGSFSFEGKEDITLSLSSLDLEKLPLHLFVPYEISGIVTTRFTLQGTAEEPLIDGIFKADGIEVNGFRIDSIRSTAAYNENLLEYSATVNPEGFQPLLISANIPASFSLKDSIMLLREDSRFGASLKFDTLDLEKIFSIVETGNTIRGFSSADIKLGNTISKPDISGMFRISEGAFRNDVYGADYSNLRFAGRIDSSRITIEELSATAGRGRLNIDGYLDVENTDSIEANNLELNIAATDFQALESGSFELNFDSDIKLDGSVGQPVFGGKLEVNESKVNIDYFTAKLAEKTDDPDPPLLLEALRDTVAVGAPADTSAPAFSGSDFYRNLKGEIVADIPGNTWITGKDMNFEIEGTLRGVKSGEAMNLFGDLNVKRGYYKLYGKTFDFEKGEINFTGGSDFNPDVDFEIVYRFRDIEKELKELTLLVTGKVMTPTLAFTLDDERLEEKDAISYIIFGKSLNQLGEGERSKISGEELAMGAAVSQLSSALRGVLQESAGVDVFEVAGGDDWKSGSFTIGKYITNNFFVSYERSFDFDKQTKTADTEKIMLEYQFLRNLVLKVTNQEINSGFDLIFKKNWK